MSTRIRIALVAIIALSVSWLVEADEPSPPSTDTLRKAISNLGSPRFAVREQASKVLWNAGIAAEPLLKEASNSDDAEVARRAREILGKFDWGVYPDTPPNVLDAIEQFKSATNPEKRQQVARELLGSGKAGCATLRKILPRVENVTERQSMFSLLSAVARLKVPGLIGAGNRAEAEEMLEIGLMGPTLDAYSDYAVFQLLNGKLDATIARIESERKAAKDTERQRLAKVLTHLYRVKSDWPNARKMALESEDTTVIDAVLWEMGDWKGLTDPKLFGVNPDGNDIGLQLAYHRLAGNEARYRELLEEAKKSADLRAEDRYEFRRLIEAMLLNGEVEDSINILRDKEKNLATLFELLCTQLRHKEAFTLADAARRRNVDSEERNELEIRRARMLYLLGDKASATQLFTRLAETLGQVDDVRDFRELIRTETRLGLREQAREHAAFYLDAQTKRDNRDNFQMLLDPLFNDRRFAAETWWWELRARNPNEPPAATMKKLCDLLEGTAGKEFDDLVKGLDTSGARPEVERFLALAEAYLAHEKKPEAEAYFRRAAEKLGSAQGWLRLGDLAAARKDYREAATRYEQAWKVKPNDPLPLFLRGLALQQDGNDAEGKRLIDIAHWLPLGDENLRCELAEELNKRGWTDAARREAELVLQTGWYRSWQVGNVISQSARWAIADKQYDRAADLYRRGVIGCMRTGASFVEPSAYLTVPQATRVYRARALLVAGKIDEANAIMQESLKVLPGNVDLAIAVVPELVKQGKRDEADKMYRTVADAYERLTTDYPSSAWAHNSAAWLAANCQRDLDRGIAHANKAIELEPKNAGYIDTLAELHFRKGERAKAIELMKKCLTIDSKSKYFRKQLVRFEKEAFDSPLPDEDDD